MRPIPGKQRYFLAAGALALSLVALSGARLIVAQTTAAATADQPQVQVIAVSVVSPEYAKAVQRFAASRSPSGRDATPLTVTVHVHSPDNLLTTDIAFDSAVDDTGRSLLVGAKVSARPQMLWPSTTNLSADRHEAFLEVGFTQGPASGAKEITLTGIAKLRVGKSTTTAKARIGLAEGTTFQAAGMTIKLDHITHYSDYALMFSVPDMTAIQSLVLTDGKDVLYASKPFRIDDNRLNKTLFYSFKDLPADAEVQVTWFDKTENVSVPFMLKFGVGY